MSSSSVQNGGPSDAQPTAADRRDSRARRVEFGAFVEVGAGEAGGFEAESLDVSTEGMRLRTAYLPSPGQTLVCRFDGVGGDVVAEGEVAWCKQQARGGELGVRFSRLDANGAALLRDLCAGQAEAAAEALPEPPSADPNEAQPGARVRLHIQGLGSPMRARVRDVAGGEVLIGSNLEFLRVGRDVQLEDVERGARRVALIEHVAVEIDPESNVPQLVVALRYEDAEREPDATDPTTRPYRVSAGAAAAPAAPIGSKETTPEPAVIARSPAGPPAAWPAPPPHFGAAAGAAPVAPAPASPAPAAALPAAKPVAEATGPAPGPAPRPASLGAPAVPPPAASDVEVAAAAAGATIARKILPALASAGAGAKGAMARLLASIRQRRAERNALREQRARADAPKRTTAPPPSGALRSDGRRLFRESAADADVPDELLLPKPNRKRAIIGAVLGVGAVLAIYAAASTITERPSDSPVAAAPTVVAEQPAAAASAGAAKSVPGAPQAPGSPGQVPTAEVPLFGATPLATTEPVPAPPPQPGEKPAGEEGDENEKQKDYGPLKTQWGVGEVNSPTVLRLKMDGKIEGIAGAEGESGFTLVIPNRKSVSSAAGLARKHKAIESVGLVNYPDRAEVTVQFKGDVPAYLARADGNRLEIEIGNDSGKGAGEAKNETKKKKKHHKGAVTADEGPAAPAGAESADAAGKADTAEDLDGAVEKAKSAKKGKGGKKAKGEAKGEKKADADKPKGAGKAKSAKKGKAAADGADKAKGHKKGKSGKKG